MIAFHTTRHTVPARTGDHDTAAAQMRNVKNGTLTTMNVNGITTDTEKQRRVAALVRGNQAQVPAEIVGLQEIKQSHDRHLPLDTDTCRRLAQHTNPGGRSYWTAYTAFLLRY
jgi:hypothetical protein